MGDPFGRYLLERLIARGGMAEVFLAHERLADGSSRPVVVKRILPQYADDPDFSEFFEQEARLALVLDHPNVARAHDFGEEGGRLYLAMEYVPGQTLLAALRRATSIGEPLGVAAIANIGVDVAGALDHMHNARDDTGRPLGIIHRDVSPHNVVCGYDGVARLVDLGVARSETQAFRTRTGVVKGKVAYLAPEMLVDGKGFDQRADLFALGTLLYEALVGRHLFRGSDDQDTLARIRRGQIPPVTRLRRDCPPALAEVVQRALERDPERRHPTARALRADLVVAARVSDIALGPAALRDEMATLFPVAASREMLAIDGDQVAEPDEGLRAAPSEVDVEAPTRPAQALALPLPAPRDTPAPVRAAPVRDFLLDRFLKLASAPRPPAPLALAVATGSSQVHVEVEAAPAPATAAERPARRGDGGGLVWLLAILMLAELAGAVAGLLRVGP